MHVLRGFAPNGIAVLAPTAVAQTPPTETLRPGTPRQPCYANNARAIAWAADACVHAVRAINVAATCPADACPTGTAPYGGPHTGVGRFRACPEYAPHP